MKHQCLLGVLVVAIALMSNVQAADDEGFKSLFNGKDFAGLKMVPAEVEKAFKVEDGVIVCSGQPFGYFATENSYKNYLLKFDVRYAPNVGRPDDTKVNSGFLIHIQGEHKVWPKCIEVQGMNRDMGDIFDIGGAKGGRYVNNKNARKEAQKPLGEWNTIEIISQDGKLTSKINGTVIGEGTSPFTEGAIGWQSEGVEIHFRNIKIRELK